MGDCCDTEAPVGVTSFVDEAYQEGEANLRPYSSSLANPQEALQDLKDYLARPRMLSSGTILFGTRTVLASHSVSSSTELFNWFPQLLGKALGAYGIRFTLRFRVQVAATAFHQGMLVLGWQYAPDPTNKGFVRVANMAAITNVPHVRLDLSKDTMVDLVVPFVSVDEFMPLPNTYTGNPRGCKYGQVSVGTLLPSNSVVGLNPASYKLYVMMEDVELFGATQFDTTTVTLQSGGVVSKETKKPSDYLSTAARVVRYVGRHIPALSAYTGPTNWALEKASGVARSFGYSKPTVQDMPAKMYQSNYTGETNVDTAFAGFVCGATQANSLEVGPEFSHVDVDEMALKYVTSQYSQICVGALSTSDTHGKVLYASTVSPAVMWFRYPASAPYCNITFPKNSANLISQSGNCFLPSSVMNAASYFRFWRGGFKYRITIAKAAMHGGRYVLSYCPSVSAHGASAATVDGVEVSFGLVQPVGYSTIIDLKGDNVLEFDVPYISESPLSPFDGTIGSITLTCIDPLQASASVATTVPFMVEVRGGDDFEPVAYGTPYFGYQPDGIIYQQSGGIVKATLDDTDAWTAGESIRSVKQLIQIPNWSKHEVPTVYRASNMVQPWFYYYPVHQYTNNLPNGDLPLKGLGRCSAGWALCYAFARGGTDVHMYVNGSENTVAVIEQYAADSFAPLDIRKSYASRPFLSNTCKVLTNKAGVVHVRCPAYARRLRWPTTMFNANTINFPLEAGQPLIGSYYLGAFYHINVANSSTTEKSYLEYATAASDDAALSHYMGPSPVFIPDAATTHNLETAGL